MSLEKKKRQRHFDAKSVGTVLGASKGSERREMEPVLPPAPSPVQTLQSLCQTAIDKQMVQQAADLNPTGTVHFTVWEQQEADGANLGASKGSERRFNREVSRSRISERRDRPDIRLHRGDDELLDAFPETSDEIKAMMTSDSDMPVLLKTSAGFKKHFQQGANGVGVALLLVNTLAEEILSTKESCVFHKGESLDVTTTRVSKHIWLVVIHPDDSFKRRKKFMRTGHSSSALSSSPSSPTASRASCFSDEYSIAEDQMIEVFESDDAFTPPHQRLYKEMLANCQSMPRDSPEDAAAHWILNVAQQNITKAKHTSAAAVDQLGMYLLHSYYEKGEIRFDHAVKPHAPESVLSKAFPTSDNSLTLRYFFDDDHSDMLDMLISFYSQKGQNKHRLYSEASREWWEEHTRKAFTQILVDASGHIVAAQTSWLMYTHYLGGGAPLFYIVALRQDEERAPRYNRGADEKISAYFHTDLVRVLLSMVEPGRGGGLLTQSLGWEYQVHRITGEVKKRASAKMKAARYYWSKHLHPPTDTNPAAIHLGAQLCVDPHFVDGSCCFFHKFYMKVSTLGGAE